MSLLAQVQCGCIFQPPTTLDLWHGRNRQEQCRRGRAWLNPLLLTEDGLNEIDCDKFPLANSFDDILNALGELATTAHDDETVVVDSLDWLERLVWDVLCAVSRHIDREDRWGLWQRLCLRALNPWRRLIQALSVLQLQRQMIILLIAHAKVERFEHPEAPAYDRYSPRLHKHAAVLLTEWCDGVLFATRRFTTRGEDAGFGRQRTIATPIGGEGRTRVAHRRWSLLAWPRTVITCHQNCRWTGPPCCTTSCCTRVTAESAAAR